MNETTRRLTPQLARLARMRPQVGAVPLRWHHLSSVGRERDGSQFGIRRWKQRRDMLHAEDARRG
jgi:hypothetical protein